MKEEQFWSTSFGAGWKLRGPEGPPAFSTTAADICVRPPDFPGPPATSSSRGDHAARRYSDAATGRAYSTQSTGRLTWRNQTWRANTQQWAISGGQYTTTTSIAIIMVVIPAIFLSLLFQRSSNRSSSTDLTITSMHCCNM